MRICSPVVLICATAFSAQIQVEVVHIRAEGEEGELIIEKKLEKFKKDIQRLGLKYKKYAKLASQNQRGGEGKRLSFVLGDYTLTLTPILIEEKRTTVQLKLKKQKKKRPIEKSRLSTVYGVPTFRVFPGKKGADIFAIMVSGVKKE